MNLCVSVGAGSVPSGSGTWTSPARHLLETGPSAGLKEKERGPGSCRKVSAWPRMRHLQQLGMLQGPTGRPRICVFCPHRR